MTEACSALWGFILSSGSGFRALSPVFRFAVLRSGLGVCIFVSGNYGFWALGLCGVADHGFWSL